MKKTLTTFILIVFVIVNCMIIGGYLFFHSWFFNAELGSIVGARSDYSIQLTHDGWLYDYKQHGYKIILSRNIKRYKLVQITDEQNFLRKYIVLIMEERSESSPVYIIYDEKFDGYIFINKEINQGIDWYGGYQSLSLSDGFVKDRYEHYINTDGWVALTKSVENP